MRHFKLIQRFRSLTALLLSAALAGSYAAQRNDPGSAIVKLLQQQAADWNRGDLPAFASGYKDAPDILFLGSTVRRGYAGMLQGYRQHYPTRTAMGQLNFSQVEVQPLDTRFATATGHFHLERDPVGGGNADGYFLLVLERTPAGWKIVRDDTTALPPKR